MPSRVGPGIRETTTDTGVGTLNLSAVAGFRRFTDEFTPTTEQFDYAIYQSATAWEEGVGTVSAGNVLTRVTCVRSSNSNAFHNFGGGTKEVISCYHSTGMLRTANNLSEFAAVLGTVWANLGLLRSGQSGGTDGKVVRWSAADTWVNAANTDTVIQLSKLNFKSGGVYYPPHSYVPGLSGLTAGAAYWLTTGGSMSTTPPTISSTVSNVFLGYAHSATVFYFAPDPAILGY